MDMAIMYAIIGTIALVVGLKLTTKQKRNSRIFAKTIYFSERKWYHIN